MSDAKRLSTRFSSQLGLFLGRFCTSAWIGAATLFVVVGVIEVTRSGFDSTTKDTLVSVRFPSFYVFGAVVIGLGWLGIWVAGDSEQLPAARRRGSLILLAIVLVLMASDYLWIYQPLLKMVTPPGQAKPSIFVSYHEASKWINLAGLVVTLLATVLVNWPVKHTVDPKAAGSLTH